jgi:hypothetical protein
MGKGYEIWYLESYESLQGRCKMNLGEKGINEVKLD